MKRLLYLLMLGLMLQACANKNYLERKDENKALNDAVKQLQKSPEDKKALEAVPILYKNVQANALAKIKSLQGSRDVSKWDKMVNEYTNLQNIYNSVMNSTAAYRLISPVDYSTQLMETKDAAAEAYYALGMVALAKNNRDAAKSAYGYFKKVEKFVPNYKDAASKMEQALDMALVEVVIGPVQDNSYFFNTGFGNYGYNYTNEYFQQSLVRELESENGGNRYAANFYTDWEARRSDVKPDWIVELNMRNMDVPYPQTYQYSRNVSRNVVVGTDTSGHQITRLATATLYITRQSFNAYASMDVRIRDVKNGGSIGSRSFNENLRWDEEFATYSGDQQALGPQEWNMVNNSRYRNNMRREDILTELYRKLYPDVKNYLSYQMAW